MPATPNLKHSVHGFGKSDVCSRAKRIAVYTREAAVAGAREADPGVDCGRGLSPSRGWTAMGGGEVRAWYEAEKPPSLPMTSAPVPQSRWVTFHYQLWGSSAQGEV